MYDRSFASDKLKVEAHRCEGQQKVGEDDRGVYSEALSGSNSHLGGDLRCAADFKQRVMLANGHIFRHVAASLAEEPHRRTIYLLPETGTDKPAAANLRLGDLLRLDCKGFLAQGSALRFQPSILGLGCFAGMKERRWPLSVQSQINTDNLE